MALPGRRKRTDAALSALRQAIAAGPFTDDDMLPGERDLAERFAVSRTTLRRILADLVAEGMLRHRQGVGTFIVRDALVPPPEPQAGSGPVRNRLPGFAEEMLAQGLVVTARDIARAVGLPTPDEAMMLACSPDERIVRLTRLRCVGALVLAVERAAVPCRCVDRPETIGPSLYAALAANGHAPVRALQRVQATAIGEEDAAHLGVPAGTTGVSVRRTAYVADGPCCEFTRSTYLAARYDAMTEIRIPPAPTSNRDAVSAR